VCKVSSTPEACGQQLRLGQDDVRFELRESKVRFADQPDNSTQARFEYAVLSFHALSSGKGLAREPPC
jgi:hypothetical protein